MTQSTPTSITASMLYNFVQCPHRLFLDRFGNPAQKDPVNPFVQLLWEKGTTYEKAVIQSLEIPFLDLSRYSVDDRLPLTLAAIERGEPLIYAGRIRADDLLGEPDLLRRVGSGYTAGDIKSGAGEETGGTDTDNRPKRHYAVQIALYTDILERLGVAAGRNPFIWDVHGREVPYDLAAPQGKRNRSSLWDYYRACLEDARHILTGSETTLPARSSICKLCHWYSKCMAQLKEADDLTLIPELGRSRRDAMSAHIRSVQAFSKADLEPLVNGRKTVFPGIGPETLVKFHTRAKLLADPEAGPFLKSPVRLPRADSELFFDIETDPMRDVCYLHGFLIRRNRDRRTERYVAFFSDDPSPEAEKKAFADAWAYVRSCRPCVIYYYSPYERTFWRKLQNRYPDVVDAGDIERMFSPDTAVDLYQDVVKSKTEWPTYDYSIKTLATFLGFHWRDTNPSGAASIEWFHRWIETRNPALRLRILQYNEDDCIATRVLLDAIHRLPLKP